MQEIQINEKLKSLVQTERKVIAEILSLIQILDITKSYRELGYSSLFNYLTSGLGYSDGAAQRRISSSRLLKQLPSIAADLESGNLNLSQVSMAHTAITQQEKVSPKIETKEKLEIIESLKHKNSFETKQLLQSKLPQYDPTPKSLVIPKNEHIQVSLSFTQSQWQEIKGFLSRNSHKVPDQKIETLLLKIAASDKTKLEKTTESSIQKSETSVQKSKISKTLLPQRQYKFRKAIPAEIRRYIYWKAQGRCQFVSLVTKKPCGSQHYLEIDHKIPVALGGTNGIENLRLFCREHNLLAAKRAHLTQL